MEEVPDDQPIFIDISSATLINDLTQEIPTVLEDRKRKSETPELLKIANKRLKCPECQVYTTDDEDKLTRHIRKVHRGENPFQCFMCDYSTYNRSLFDEHVRIHKGDKPFKCSFCPHRNVSKKNLKRHERIHRADNPLKCPHCDHIARHKRGFDFHAKTCHSVKGKAQNLKCKYCEKYFDNEGLLRHTKSLKKCHEFEEDETDPCEYTTCTAAVLKVHKAIVHRKVKEKMKNKKDVFKCALCEWSSSNKTRILLHLIHHPHQEVDETRLDVSILRKHGIMT